MMKVFVLLAGIVGAITVASPASAQTPSCTESFAQIQAMIDADIISGVPGGITAGTVNTLLNVGNNCYANIGSPNIFTALQTVTTANASQALLSIAPAVSGNGTYNTAATQFGGRELVATNALSNAIVGAAIQDGSNGNSFPTGVTGYGYLNNAGNVVFGVFGRADCYTAGACVNELNSFNYAGAAYNSFPANVSFGTTQILPIALNLEAYGTYPSYAYIYVSPTSVGTAGAVIGEYFGAGSAVYGLVVDATSSAGAGVAATLNTTGGAGVVNLFMQMKGSPGSGAQFIGAYNSGSAEVFSVGGSGVVTGAGFIAGTSTGVSCSGSPTSSFASVNGIVTHC